MSAKLLNQTRAFYRANLAGELQFDEHIRPLKIVIGSDGRAVAPVMVAMLQAMQTVLFLPHADEESLQVLVSLEQFEESSEHGHRVDRWQIYHGEPEDVRWAFVNVDCAKHLGAVIDGQAIEQPNPLADIEATVCQQLNADQSALRKFVQMRRKLDLEKPLLVGIDPWGMDIRGPFDIVRVEFDAMLEDPIVAADVITEMVAAGGSI